MFTGRRDMVRAARNAGEVQPYGRKATPPDAIHFVHYWWMEYGREKAPPPIISRLAVAAAVPPLLQLLAWSDDLGRSLAWNVRARWRGPQNPKREIEDPRRFVDLSATLGT
ncbi:hypothetical protein MTO96_048345 [Rhipicephalus appendiculatus]